MKYYLIAGEASGDLHASHLMRRIKEFDAKAEFRFYGGDKMAEVGGEPVVHYRDLAFMGFVQVLKHLPQILKGMKHCQEDIKSFAPDAVILVDYPGFNLRVAKWVKKNLSQVKVVYYISPKIWAWKEWRIKDIKRYVDLMLSILPFEIEFYRSHQYEIQYVGNPTVDELAPLHSLPVEKTEFCARHGLKSTDRIVALIPGSRKAELMGNLPLMLRALGELKGRLGCSSLPILVAGAPGLSPEFYSDLLSRLAAKGVVEAREVKVIFGETESIMRVAHVAAVTSGTATLEAAYLGAPQVVCYSMGGGMLFYRIMKFVLRKIHYVSLVNLLLGKEGVKELLGPYLTSTSLASELYALWGDTPNRLRQQEDYEEMRRILGPVGAPIRAAKIIINEISKHEVSAMNSIDKIRTQV